ncbi:MAG: efflux RND transporter permease subunit [Elusimicrobia bacterium]|nr:efflux RND transporter permease subunit [Candidatus Liberimonas magnetica]
MNLLRLPVDRPVTTIMLFLAISLFGVISWSRIPQELFPSMEFPQITIVTKYEGAGPEEAEKLISKLVEESMGTVKNIKKVSSVSKEGVSIVTCEFRWGTNMNFSAMEVREKIDLIKEALPKESRDPIVLKYNPMQVEAMILSASYKNEETSLWKMAELRSFCKKNIKDEMERIDGVAKVEVRGGEKKEILVEIDKGRLLANQISIMDVISSLKNANVTYPAGTIKEQTYEYLVKTVGEFQTISDISSLAFSAQEQPNTNTYAKQIRGEPNPNQRRDKIIFIRDIAEVKEALRDQTGFSRYDMKENISLGIFPQSGANLVKMSELIKKKLEEVKLRTPKNIDIKMIYDQSEFIKASIDDIYENAIEGGIFTFITLLIFMRSASASVIINLAIPISTFVTLILMYFQNITINTMSLGGIVIGFGFVVDSANVVMEAIIVDFHNKPGKNQKDLVYEATVVLVPSVISSTLTSIAIFIPFIFITGMAGQLFKQMALTITFGMIASIFVALFLVPTFLAKMDLSKFSIEFGQSFSQKYFIPNLRSILKWGWGKMLFVLGIYTFFGLLFFVLIPKEFMPKADERRFILNLSMTPDTPLNITNDISKRIERHLQTVHEIKDMSVIVGSTGDEVGSASVETLGSYQARIVARLNRKGRSTNEVVSKLSDEIKTWNIKNITTEFITEQGLFGSSIGSGSGLVVEVKGKNLNSLKERSEEIKERMEKINNFYGIKINPSGFVPQLKVVIDRERASLFGLSTQDISAMSLAAIKGHVATKLKTKDDEYDIRVRMRPGDRDSLEKVNEMTAYSPSGMTIQLKQISQSVFVDSLPEIKRSEGDRTYFVTSNVKGSFNKAVSILQKVLEELPKKEDIVTNIAGEMLAIQESMASSGFAMILGVIIIFMILASEFESLRQPLIVMFAVPLGVLGAVYTLYFTGQSINSISMLGMIMLLGQAVSISIFLVDRYNYMQENNTDNLGLEDIIVEATSSRLRPVLMTTLTSIVGLIPLALGLGQEGSGSNQSMAITVIGGLSFALGMSLFFVPLIYFLTSAKPAVELPPAEQPAVELPPVEPPLAKPPDELPQKIEPPKTSEEKKQEPDEDHLSL